MKIRQTWETGMTSAPSVGGEGTVLPSSDKPDAGQRFKNCTNLHLSAVNCSYLHLNNFISAAQLSIHVLHSSANYRKLPIAIVRAHSRSRASKFCVPIEIVEKAETEETKRILFLPEMNFFEFGMEVEISTRFKMKAKATLLDGVKLLYALVMRVLHFSCLATILFVATILARSQTQIPGDGNFTIGPEYKDAAELTPRAGVAKGTVHEFTMSSKDSKIYPGLNGPYERKVWVYVPARYKKGTSAPLLIVQDGKGYLKRVTNILDNLIAERRLPPMVAVFINAGGGDGKGSERGLEYDTLSDRYARFIEEEVLPRITRDYGIKFSKDPDARATMGGSSGGACALTMGWYRTDRWHRIITFSGTFVAQQSPDDPKTPHGAWEYHEHLIPQSESKPLRIWLEVGNHDIGFDRDEATYHNWVMANERMASVLKAKGYHYHYDFAKEAKHVDGKVLGQTLPEALLWAWQGYTDHNR